MRLLFPALGVLILGLIVGCGGSSVGGTDTSSGTTSGSTSGSSSRAIVGSYTAVMAGTQTTGGTVSATGVGSAFEDGTIGITYTETDGTTTSSRTLTAAVTTAAVASGSITFGSTTLPFTAGTLTTNTDGTYLLTVSTVTGTGDAAVTETNNFTLTANRPAPGNFIGTLTGTDNKGGTYTGNATFSLSSDGNFDLSYSSSRLSAGTTITQSHTIATNLKTDHTISDLLWVGPSINVSSTGTWVANTDGTVTLTLTYINTSYSTSPKATETFTLTRLTTG